MTMNQIIKKINKIFNEPFQVINAEWENDHSYEAYGEGSFPIRLSQKQAEEIYNFLAKHNVEYWLGEPIKVNPKAVYEIWIRSCIYERIPDSNEENFSVREDYLWGLRRVTESPDRR